MSELAAPQSEGSINKATARVLEILMALTQEPDSLGVSELSRRLNMTKSMVHRGLSTLLREGYVVRDPSGLRYQLGFRVLEFAGRSGSTPEITSMCQPFMNQFAAISGESIILTVRRGDTAVTIGGIEGRGAIARRVPTGRVLPLHLSAAARAILAFLRDEDIDSYVRRSSLERVTEHSLGSIEEVWNDVRLTREQGYARGLYDHARTAYGVSFPILDRVGYPHGSMTVSGPRERLTVDRLEYLMPELLRVAAEMNRHSRLYRAVPSDD